MEGLEANRRNELDEKRVSLADVVRRSDRGGGAHKGSGDRLVGIIRN